MAVCKLTAKNARGQNVVGALHVPDGVARPPLIVSCPGLMSSKDGKKHLAMGAQAETRGLALLRVDFSGIGESEGDFANSVLTQRVEDTRAVLRAAMSNYPLASGAAFVGSSFGAPTALLCAVQEERSRAVVTWAGAIDFAAALAFSNPEAGAALGRGEIVETEDAEQTYTLTPEFLGDFALYDFADCTRRLGSVPTLFIHGKLDSSVPYRQSQQLFDWARDPKRLVLFEQGTHTLDEVIPELLKLSLDWCAEAFSRP